MNEETVETRMACNCYSNPIEGSEVCRTCPRCGQPMSQDKATGEWVCTHCC